MEATDSSAWVTYTSGLQKSQFQKKSPSSDNLPFLAPRNAHHRSPVSNCTAQTHTHTSCSRTLNSGNKAVAHGPLTALVKTTCAVHAAKMLVLVHQATKANPQEASTTAMYYIWPLAPLTQVLWWQELGIKEGRISPRNPFETLNQICLLNHNYLMRHLS